MWFSAHQIDAQQLQALAELATICKSCDGDVIPYYPHIISQYRSTPCNILYYQDQQLVGFLSVFFFYSDACEIAMMVSPQFRRQGIAQCMLGGITPLLQTQRVENIIFSTSGHMNKIWFAAKGFSYHNSEFEMHMIPQQPLPLSSYDVFIRQANDTDLESLCFIDKCCFSFPQAESINRFTDLLQSAKHKLFLIIKDEQIIGKAHLFFHENQSRLSDIAILPTFQKRGYGSQLIKFCVNYAYAHKQLPVFLDVETTNQTALKLYTNIGFAVTNARDFWAIALNDIMCVYKHKH